MSHFYDSAMRMFKHVSQRTSQFNNKLYGVNLNKDTTKTWSLLNPPINGLFAETHSYNVNYPSTYNVSMYNSKAHHQHSFFYDNGNTVILSSHHCLPPPSFYTYTSQKDTMNETTNENTYEYPDGTKGHDNSSWNNPLKPNVFPDYQRTYTVSAMMLEWMVGISLLSAFIIGWQFFSLLNEAGKPKESTICTSCQMTMDVQRDGYSYSK